MLYVFDSIAHASTPGYFFQNLRTDTPIKIRFNHTAFKKVYINFVMINTPAAR